MLAGCSIASAIRSPSSPKALPSANLPSSAWHTASQAREHHGQDDLAKVLVAPCPLERCQRLPQAGDRPTRVTLGLVGLTEVEVRQPMQDDITAGRGEGEGALAGGDGLIIRAHKAEMEGQKDQDLAQPARVIERCSEGFGLAQRGQDTSPSLPMGGARSAGRAGGRQPARACRSAPAGATRALSACSKTPAPRDRPTAPGPSPPPVGSTPGFVPHLALGEVVCQSDVVLGQPVRIEVLDGLPHGPVQGLAALHQETLVGDILDHRVLEDVGRFRHEPLLVDDLQGLQLAEQPSSRSLSPATRARSRTRNCRPITDGQLHGAFAVVPEPVQAGHNDPLDGVRDMHLTEAFHETVATVVALEDTQIEQGLRHLLDEQGHALGLRHEGGLESAGNCAVPRTWPAIASVSASEKLCSVSVVVKAAAPKGGV